MPSPTLRSPSAGMPGLGQTQQPNPFIYGIGSGQMTTLALGQMLGTDDPDLWEGVRVQLYSTKVEFQGKRVDGLRVCEPPPRSAAKSVAKVTAKPAPVNDTNTDADAPVDDAGDYS